MNYKLGDIFYDDAEYTDRGIFCDRNGYIIQPIEPDEYGRKRFQIQQPPKEEPTQEELAQIEIMELEQWFKEYDKQTIQYQRSLRLAIGFDKDITELDNQAVINANRIKELRTLLDLKN